MISRRAAASWLVVAPFAVLVVALLATALTTSWRPVHDFAFLELRVRDFGGAETPLLGPYSRYGWSHPGPLLFAVLAVPYRLLLNSSNGLLVGAVLINGASIAGILLVAWRRGGASMLGWTALLLAVFTHALGGELLISPWNPLVTILPVVLCLYLAWAVTMGDHVALPFLAAGASFLVQTHVQYGLIMAAVVAWSLAWYAIDARRRSRSTRRTDPAHQPEVGDQPAHSTSAPTSAPNIRRWWIATGVVSLVLWVPPLLDQVAGSGNLGSIIRFFATSGEPGPGRRAALGVAGRELGPLGSWITGDVPLQLFTGQVDPAAWWTWLVPFAALAVAALVAVRRRDRPALRFVGVATVAALAATASITRLAGPVWDYLVLWLGGVALVVWTAAGWAFLHAGERWVRPRLRRRMEHPARLELVAGAVVVLVVALLLATTPNFVGADPPEADRGVLVDELAAELLPALEEVDGPVSIRPVDTEAAAFPAPSSGQLAAGLALALERDGKPIRVIDQDWELAPGSGGARLFDDHRVADGPVAGTLSVVSGRALDGYVPDPRAVEVARVEDEVARVRQTELEAELADAFREEGFPDAADAVPTEELNQIYWQVPELRRYAPEISEILALRETPRAAVWWVPTP